MMTAKGFFNGFATEYDEDADEWIYSDTKKSIAKLRNSPHVRKVMINGKQVELDIEMIPLIKAMNRMGLITDQCCSGHKIQHAYVSIKTDNIRDIAIRDKGKRLVIWWKR